MRLLHITTSQPTRGSTGSFPLWPRGWLGATVHHEGGSYHISLAQEKIKIQNSKYISIECILLSHHCKVKEIVSWTILSQGPYELPLCRPHMCSCVQSPEQNCVNPLRTRTPAHLCSDPSMLTQCLPHSKSPQSQRHLSTHLKGSVLWGWPTSNTHETKTSSSDVWEVQRDILPWT